MPATEFIVGLGEDLYRIERPWGSVPDSVAIDVVSQVAVDSHDNVYVCQRIAPPVIVLSPNGEYITSWGTGVISDAHGIFITVEDRILIVDRDAHQIIGFTSHGEIEFVIGERHRPRFQAPFNHPTAVAAAPDGELYVADGYGNSQVHRFDAEGRWLQSWGVAGSGPGEFTTPHAVWVTEDGHVLVADRENNRVQRFTRDGGYLDEWDDLYHPMAIYGDAQGRTYVTDQIPRLSLFDGDGQLLGRCRPVLFGAHGIWRDGRGNIYLAETAPMDRISRLTPISSDSPG